MAKIKEEKDPVLCGKVITSEAFEDGDDEIVFVGGVTLSNKNLLLLVENTVMMCCSLVGKLTGKSVPVKDYIPCMQDIENKGMNLFYVADGRCVGPNFQYRGSYLFVKNDVQALAFPMITKDLVKSTPELDKSFDSVADDHAYFSSGVAASGPNDSDSAEKSGDPEHEVSDEDDNEEEAVNSGAGTEMDANDDENRESADDGCVDLDDAPDGTESGDENAVAVEKVDKNTDPCEEDANSEVRESGSEGDDEDNDEEDDKGEERTVPPMRLHLLKGSGQIGANERHTSMGVAPTAWAVQPEDMFSESEMSSKEDEIENFFEESEDYISQHSESSDSDEHISDGPGLFEDDEEGDPDYVPEFVEGHSKKKQKAQKPKSPKRPFKKSWREPNTDTETIPDTSEEEVEKNVGIENHDDDPTDPDFEVKSKKRKSSAKAKAKSKAKKSKSKSKKTKKKARDSSHENVQSVMDGSCVEEGTAPPETEHKSSSKLEKDSGGELDHVDSEHKPSTENASTDQDIENEFQVFKACHKQLEKHTSEPVQSENISTANQTTSQDVENESEVGMRKRSTSFVSLITKEKVVGINVAVFNGKATQSDSSRVDEANISSQDRFKSDSYLAAKCQSEEGTPNKTDSTNIVADSQPASPSKTNSACETSNVAPKSLSDCERPAQKIDNAGHAESPTAEQEERQKPSVGQKSGIVPKEAGKLVLAHIDPSVREERSSLVSAMEDTSVLKKSVLEADDTEGKQSGVEKTSKGTKKLTENLKHSLEKSLAKDPEKVEKKYLKTDKGLMLMRLTKVKDNSDAQVDDASTDGLRIKSGVSTTKSNSNTKKNLSPENTVKEATCVRIQGSSLVVKNDVQSDGIEKRHVTLGGKQSVTLGSGGSPGRYKIQPNYVQTPEVASNVINTTGILAGQVQTSAVRLSAPGQNSDLLFVPSGAPIPMPNVSAKGTNTTGTVAISLPQVVTAGSNGQTMMPSIPALLTTCIPVSPPVTYLSTAGRSHCAQIPVSQTVTSARPSVAPGVTTEGGSSVAVGDVTRGTECSDSERGKGVKVDDKSQPHSENVNNNLPKLIKMKAGDFLLIPKSNFPQHCNQLGSKQTSIADIIKQGVPASSPIVSSGTYKSLSSTSSSKSNTGQNIMHYKASSSQVISVSATHGSTANESSPKKQPPKKSKLHAAGTAEESPPKKPRQQCVKKNTDQMRYEQNRKRHSSSELGSPSAKSGKFADLLQGRELTLEIPKCDDMLVSPDKATGHDAQDASKRCDSNEMNFGSPSHLSNSEDVLPKPISPRGQSVPNAKVSVPSNLQDNPVDRDKDKEFSQPKLTTQCPGESAKSHATYQVVEVPRDTSKEIRSDSTSQSDDMTALHDPTDIVEGGENLQSCEDFPSPKPVTKKGRPRTQKNIPALQQAWIEVCNPETSENSVVSRSAKSGPEKTVRSKEKAAKPKPSMYIEAQEEQNTAIFLEARPDKAELERTAFVEVKMEEKKEEMHGRRSGRVIKKPSRFQDFNMGPRHHEPLNIKMSELIDDHSEDKMVSNDKEDTAEDKSHHARDSKVGRLCQGVERSGKGEVGSEDVGSCEMTPGKREVDNVDSSTLCISVMDYCVSKFHVKPNDLFLKRRAFCLSYVNVDVENEQKQLVGIKCTMSTSDLGLRSGAEVVVAIVLPDRDTTCRAVVELFGRENAVRFVNYIDGRFVETVPNLHAHTLVTSSDDFDKFYYGGVFSLSFDHNLIALIEKKGVKSLDEAFDIMLCSALTCKEDVSPGPEKMNIISTSLMKLTSKEVDKEQKSTKGRSNTRNVRKSVLVPRSESPDLEASPPSRLPPVQHYAFDGQKMLQLPPLGRLAMLSSPKSPPGKIATTPKGSSKQVNPQKKFGTMVANSLPENSSSPQLGGSGEPVPEKVSVNSSVLQSSKKGVLPLAKASTSNLTCKAKGDKQLETTHNKWNENHKKIGFTLVVTINGVKTSFAGMHFILKKALLGQEKGSRLNVFLVDDPSTPAKSASDGLKKLFGPDRAKLYVHRGRLADIPSDVVNKLGRCVLCAPSDFDIMWKQDILDIPESKILTGT